MLIKTEADFERLVDLRVALNSLDFALARLSKLDKDNFAEIFYRGDYENLEKGKKALDDLIRNS